MRRFATRHVVERVLAPSGVRVEKKEGLVLGGQPAEELNERDVLEHIAEIAGVVAMLILQAGLKPGRSGGTFILRTLDPNENTE